MSYSPTSLDCSSTTLVHSSSSTSTSNSTHRHPCYLLWLGLWLWWSCLPLRPPRADPGVLTARDEHRARHRVGADLPDVPCSVGPHRLRDGLEVLRGGVEGEGAGRVGGDEDGPDRRVVVAAHEVLCGVRRRGDLCTCLGVRLEYRALLL